MQIVIDLPLPKACACRKKKANDFIELVYNCLKTQSDLDRSSPQLQAASFHDLTDDSRRDTSWPALHTVPTCRGQTEITCTQCLHTLDMYNKRRMLSIKQTKTNKLSEDKFALIRLIILSEI